MSQHLMVVERHCYAPEIYASESVIVSMITSLEERVIGHLRER